MITFIVTLSKDGINITRYIDAPDQQTALKSMERDYPGWQTADIIATE